MQRARVQAEASGRVVRAFDPPTTFLDDPQDVGAFDLFEAFSTIGGGMSGATLTNDSSTRSVEPGERMTARSMTFSSSRTLPGQE